MVNSESFKVYEKNHKRWVTLFNRGSDRTKKQELEFDNLTKWLDNHKSIYSKKVEDYISKRMRL